MKRDTSSLKLAQTRVRKARRNRTTGSRIQTQSIKQRLSLFRGGGVYFCLDATIVTQSNLRTKDEREALTLLNAKNESFRQPVLDRQIARTCMADPAPDGPEWEDLVLSVTIGRVDREATTARLRRLMPNGSGAP
jgi:hypothetical protein